MRLSTAVNLPLSARVGRCLGTGGCPMVSLISLAKGGKEYRMVAQVDVSAMPRAPKGNAAGSAWTSAAEARASPEHPVAKPLAMGSTMWKRSLNLVPKLAPMMPVMQQLTVVSEVDAPRTAACTTARAAVALGRRQSLISCAGSNALLRPARVKMPKTVEIKVPAMMGMKFAWSSVRLAYRPKAKLMMEGSSQNMMKLPAAANMDPPPTMYSCSNSKKPMPLSCANRMNVIVAALYVVMRGCQYCLIIGEKTLGIREAKMKDRKVVATKKVGLAWGTASAAAPESAVTAAKSFSISGENHDLKAAFEGEALAPPCLAGFWPSRRCSPCTRCPVKPAPPVSAMEMMARNLAMSMPGMSRAARGATMRAGMKKEGRKLVRSVVAGSMKSTTLAAFLVSVKQRPPKRSSMPVSVWGKVCSLSFVFMMNLRTWLRVRKAAIEGIVLTRCLLWSTRSTPPTRISSFSSALNPFSHV
mmetsp:Transcript_39057/g.91217  ORF Transcript_39057/g.91217 Transcript_39057/m.91217 type:complete len:471 (-) Transcript_39057:253-1665(-)